MTSALLAWLLVVDVPVPAPAAPPPRRPELTDYRQQAEVAERNGDPAAADHAAQMYLDAAGAAALSAAWLAPSKPGGDAAADVAALDEAATFVVPLAARHENWMLVLRALGWSPRAVERHRKELHRALAAASFGAHSLPDDVVRAAAAADPLVALSLSDDGPGRSGGASVAQAVAAGAAGTSWLEGELERGLTAGDRDVVRRAAEALVAGDAANLQALLALEMLQEDPQRLRRANLDINRLVRNWRGDVGQVLMRLHQALAREPGAVRLRLALAWRQLRAGVAADAQREAKSIAANAAASPRAREAATIIAALAALELADGRAFTDWFAKRAGRPSHFVVAQVLRDFGYIKSPPTIVDVRRAVFARALAAQPPLFTSYERSMWGWPAINDTKLDEATRRRALDLVVGGDVELTRVSRSCASDKLALDACVARVVAVNGLRNYDDDDDDRDEGGEAIDAAALPGALGPNLEISPSWLEALQGLPADKLALLAPWVDRLRARPVARTRPFALLDIHVRWARKDITGARRAIDEALPRMQPAERVALRLLAEDVERKLVPADRIDATFLVPADVASMLVGEPSTGPQPAWLADFMPGKDRLSALRRGVSLLGSGHARAALDNLRPLLGALSGAERGELAGYVFVAAVAAGDDAVRAQAAAQLSAHAPSAATAARIAATPARAVAAADPVGPDAPVACWLRAAPTSDAAARAWLIAAAAHNPSFPPGAQAQELIARAGRILGGRFAGPGALASAGHRLDPGCWKAMVADKDDLATLCPAATLAALGKAQPDLVMKAMRRVGVARDGAAIVRAARAAAHLASETAYEPRDRLAWLWFVAGDLAKSRAVRAKDASKRADADADAEADDASALALLLAGQPSRDARRRRDLFTQLGPQTYLPQSDDDKDKDSDARPALDWSAAARDAGSARQRADVWQLACQAANRQSAAEVLAACGAAWRQGRRTPAVATALAGALFGDAEAARKQGFDAKNFLAEARKSLGDRTPGAVKAHEARWLVTLGKRREAAAAYEDAWSSGGGHVGEGVGSDELTTAEFNPMLGRYRAAIMGTRSHKAFALALLSISAGDMQAFAPYTAAARAFYDAEADHDNEKGLALFEDMQVLIAADTADRALDPPGIVRVSRRLFEPGTKEPLPDLQRAYPRSSLVALLVLEDATSVDDSKAQVARAKQLVARFPNLAIVASDCAALLQRAGLRKEASALFDAAKAAHPDNPFIRGHVLPDADPVPARPATKPTPFASAESWSRVLAQNVDVPGDAAAVHEVHDDEQGFSAVLPATFKQQTFTEKMTGFSSGGVNILFTRAPRMTYCEGLACLDELLPALQLQGLKKQWRRVLTTPVGPGAEAYLASSSGAALIVASIPAGGNTYFVMAGGPVDQLATQTSAIRMAYRTFRPLDLVLPQPVSQRLSGYRAVDARTWLQARLATAKPAQLGTGCPLASALDAATTPSVRRELLLDAFLTTPWSSTRLRLLGCDSADAPLLTLAGLWDEDRAVRKLAGERARANPDAVLVEAKRMMANDKPIEPGAGSTGASQDHRWMQLVVVLPAKQRTELVRALLRRDEPHLRAVGLLAPRFGEVDSGSELLRIVRDGPTADVRIAMYAFPDVLAQPLREAIWARFDRAKAPLAAGEKELLFGLAGGLAHDRKPGDNARLARLVKLVSPPGRKGERTEAAADRFRAEALLRPATGSPAPAPARAAVGRLAPADRPLAEMLPGNHWSYLRIPRPELLLSRLGRLGRRLKASSLERQSLSQKFITRVVGEATSVRADAGGVDLTRPIECASPDGKFGELICAATLETDVASGHVETLRSLNVIQMVTVGAVVLPVVLPGLPFLLHENVYRKTETTGDGKAPALVHESAELLIDVPEGVLTWNADIDIGSDGRGDVDDKIVVRSKQRLLFSNSPALARRFLMPPAGGPVPAVRPPALGADPAFAAAAGRFVEGADVTAIVVNPDGDAGAQQRPATLEMTITARGVAARLRLPFRDRGADHRAGRLSRMLPKNPALVFGAGEIGWGEDASGPQSPARGSVSLAPAEGAGLEPPTWLADATSALAFGWYPRAGGRFWDNWLGAVTWDDKVAAVWRRRGMPEPSADGKPATHGGYRFRLAGATLLVTNDQALLDQAASKPVTEPPAASEEPVTGMFDGGQVATSLEDLAERAPSREAGFTLRGFAALASVVKTATLTSVVDRQRAEVVIESLLTPEMEGATPSSMVDEWVAEPQIRNTLVLPRVVVAPGAGKPIRFVIEVEHDRNFVRAFPSTSRQQVERMGQGRWRVSVSPAPAIDQPVRAEPMSAAERARWLDAGKVSPRIASAANEIIPDKTDSRQAAQLLIEWMKRNMTYELTPRNVSDEAILERRRGDCSEYSKLAVALLRARGIPARTRSGFLAESSTLVAHAWVEFFDGTGWREIDPVNGTPSVDARYLDASVVDVLSLLSLAQIRVAAVE